MHRFGVLYREHLIKPSRQAPRWRTGPCFIDVRWSKIKSIDYLCPIDNILTEEEIAFWLGFIATFLRNVGPDGATPTYSYERADMDGRRWMMWHLENLSTIPRKNLLYLTAFRYPNEQRLIVKQLFKDRAPVAGKDDGAANALFMLFQEMQLDVVYQRGKYKGANLEVNAVHGLVFPDLNYLEPEEQPITLAQFRANLLNPAIATVQNHFRDPALQRVARPRDAFDQLHPQEKQAMLRRWGMSEKEIHEALAAKGEGGVIKRALELASRMGPEWD